MLCNRLRAGQAGWQWTHNSWTPSRGLVEGADKVQAKRGQQINLPSCCAW